MARMNEVIDLDHQSAARLEGHATARPHRKLVHVRLHNASAAELDPALVNVQEASDRGHVVELAGGAEEVANVYRRSTAPAAALAKSSAICWLHATVTAVRNVVAHHCSGAD
jgi:hypothetical protein